MTKPSTPTVLIVDDEDTFSSALQEILRDGGLQVDVAHDGAEALRALEEKQPTVVITDLNMPEMDGVTLIQEARNRGLSTEFVICTGYPSDATRTRASDLNVAKYFTKPVRLEEVKAAIRELLQNRAAG